MNIVCLEQGEWMDPAQLPGTSTDWEVRQLGDFNFSPNTRQRREDYPVNDSESPIAVSMFNAVGGSTILYAAHFPRFRPTDFRVRSLDGVADDWPVDYARLEPYYDMNAHMMGVSGLAIGIFKTGALALVGDVSRSTAEHTAVMNTAEGFFGIGSIVGPAILAQLLSRGVSWKWLYVIAACVCGLLIAMTLLVKYPRSSVSRGDFGANERLSAIRNPYVLAFSAGAFLYVGVEAAIYVWMPTLFASYRGPLVWVSAYSISIFFLLRAAGRFLGGWMLLRFRWHGVLALFSGTIFLCFILSMIGGVTVGIYLLPLSGLFMSVIYPTINSKGISCLPRSEHGSAAGVILFFTCVSAVLAPLMMGLVSDVMGHIAYGFWLATGLAALLFVGLLLNWMLDPTRSVLERLDASEYRHQET